ncbi:MAG: hypothetical protein AAGA60_30080 [Cyanobacteria bacterium P01_E01_bin.42]
MKVEISKKNGVSFFFERILSSLNQNNRTYPFGKNHPFFRTLSLSRRLKCLFGRSYGLFANNVGLRGFLFADNVVRKMPCLWVGAFMFAGRYTYPARETIENKSI